MLLPNYAGILTLPVLETLESHQHGELHRIIHLSFNIFVAIVTSYVVSYTD